MPLPRLAAILSMALLCQVSPPAWGQSGDADVPIARVGSEAVTQSDLDEALAAGRGQRPGASPDTVRAEVRNRLIAELWAHQVFGEEARSDPELRATLQAAERQILFQMYAQSRFEPEAPTEAEIDAYIAANPAFFAERVEYRLQTFRILPELALETSDLAAIIAPLSLPPITEDTTAALARALADAGIPFEQQNLWSGGEALPEPLRARLETMRAGGRPVHISTGPELTEIIVLFEARPAPVDPAAVRDQVASRLVEAAFEAFSRSLAADIATPLIADTAEQADRAGRTASLSPRLLTAIGAMGTALGFLWASALSWSLQTRRLFRIARRESDDDALPTLQRPGPVALLALVATATVTAIALGALATRPQVLLSLSGLAMLIGLWSLAGGLGALLWRPAEEGFDPALERQRAAGRRFGLATAGVLVVCAAFLAYPLIYQ